MSINPKKYFLGPKEDKKYEKFIKQVATHATSLFLKKRKGGSFILNEKNATKFVNKIEKELNLNKGLPPSPNQEKQITKALNKFFDNKLSFAGSSYFAHMITEPSLIALYGYIFGLIQNGNLVECEVSPVASILEERVADMLKELVGYKRKTKKFKQAIAMITAGGTDANIMALWAARGRAYPGLENKGLRATDKVPKILVPVTYHYSFDKIANLLMIGKDNIIKIKVDNDFHINSKDLKEKLFAINYKSEKVIAVVATMGTTESGSINNINEIIKIVKSYERRKKIHLNKNKIWVHVDAAYGGPAYTIAEVASHTGDLTKADSIALDPHKLLYVPYNTGGIIFKNKNDVSYIRSKATYLKSLREGFHLSAFKIIGSQSIAGTVATYAVLKTLGKKGIASIIQINKERTKYLKDKLESIKHKNFYVEIINKNPDLNILLFRTVPRKKFSIRKINTLNENIKEAISKKTKYEISYVSNVSHTGKATCRIVIMNPHTNEAVLDNFVRQYKKISQEEIKKIL